MRPRPFVAGFAAALALLALPVPSRSAAPADRIWFCPGPGTLDYLRLFEDPDDWPHARQIISVFKFYQQHTRMPADPIVGPDTYDALVRADAFRSLQRWGKTTAIEVAAVKEFYCTPDASGMRAAVDDTLTSVRAVQAAGGSVTFLAMDEPFVSGRASVCGGPALEPTADRVATYVSGVHTVFSDVRIGLIEAYPFSSAAALETALQLLQGRNAAPAFLHMDVDWHLAGSTAFVRDMARLKSVCAAAGIRSASSSRATTATPIRFTRSTSTASPSSSSRRLARGTRCRTTSSSRVGLNRRQACESHPPTCPSAPETRTRTCCPTCIAG